MKMKPNLTNCQFMKIILCEVPFDDLREDYKLNVFKKNVLTNILGLRVRKQ
jgi:hypothetical protein